MEKIVLNFWELVNKIPFLPLVISKINEANIKYWLYSGSYVSLITTNRVVNDVDILVAYEDILKLKEIFPFAETKDYGDCILLYIGQNKEIEFMSYPRININNSKYYLCLTQICWENIIKIKYKKLYVNILNPVDTILQKAFLQRWKEQWKYDLEDIFIIIQKNIIDEEYLKKRILEFKNYKEITPLLWKYNLLENRTKNV